MSQTVVLENPLRPQRMDSAGVSRTYPRTVATVTPRSPIAAVGIGSRISPTSTAAKRAK